jgi:hypothetical protein
MSLIPPELLINIKDESFVKFFIAQTIHNQKVLVDLMMGKQEELEPSKLIWVNSIILQYDSQTS